MDYCVLFNSNKFEGKKISSSKDGLFILNLKGRN